MSRKKEWVQVRMILTPQGSHQVSEDFINRIQRERDAGFGFVPLVGAGFSAPSGVPLVAELRMYLQRCLWLAMVNKTRENRWHPYTDQWPPFIHRESDDVPGISYLAELSGAVKDVWRREGTSGSKKASLLAQALGAAEDWRTALLFLSRLRHSPRRRLQCEAAADLDYWLGAPQPELIDLGLREALSRKYPSLNHNMLGVLAGLLRLNIVLTTNFDDLLERAFAEARNGLEVFEVHIGDHLPHWSAVSQVRSLIKMHGNRHSLRADYSLDEKPGEIDRMRFLEYLRAGKNEARGLASGHSHGTDFENHLLVMGVGGTEDRTLELIKHAHDNLSHQFKIFWLCYSDGDVAAIQDFATRRLRQSTDDSVIILRHTNYGLLLLQLYQAIRRNLPPFGGLFPSTARLPVPPLPTNTGLPHIKEYAKKILSRLESFQNEGDGAKLKLVVATSDPGIRGVTSACSDVFSQMEQRSACLWLDMNDITSTDDLFEVLLEAAYVRLGQENWVPTHHETNADVRSEEIKRLVLSGEKPWVIFLNARETPGANTQESLAEDFPNGWLDCDECPTTWEFADRSRCSTEFLDLIRQLCGEASKRISLVLMCRDDGRDSGLLKRLKSNSPWMGRDRLIRLSASGSADENFSKLDVVARAIAWTQGEERRQRFLHSLILMQRPRLLATIWSDATCLPTDTLTEGGDSRPVWISELEATGLVRRKAGGFIWLHSPSRECARGVLWKRMKLPDVSEEARRANTILEKWNALAEEAEIHGRLAKWYEKVLEASNEPAAVFEVTYHLCLAARRHLEYETGDRVADACHCIDAASAILSANGFLIQTRGYARGSCRRLNHIRRSLCGQILAADGKSRDLLHTVRRLQLICTQVMRMTAREVGEDGKAFVRHQQYGDLLRGLSMDSIPEDVRETGKGVLSRAVLERLKQTGAGVETGVAADVEWAQWWRWNGMLGTASRSYHAASKSFDNALQCVIHPLEVPRPECAIGLDDSRQLEAALLRNRSPEMDLEAVRIVEQYAGLLLLRYNLDNRVERLDRDLQGRAPALGRIRNLIAVGRKLTARVCGRDWSSTSHYTISANWCESRLLIHQAICLSLRMQNQRVDDGAIGSVMGLLGDAEANLRVSDPRRYRSELAIVELHRAESRVQRAEAVVVAGLDGDEVSFSAMYRSLQQHPLSPATDTRLREELSKPFADLSDRALLRVRALVADGVRFLDRAEPILRKRRRNVRWTTWFFERYLRLISMSVWGAVFEKGTPIPFLGLEAAPSGTASIADEMLDDALRMIGADTYRLATILDAYASCARALQFRLMLEDRSTDLVDRRGRMLNNLNRSLRQLERCEQRRQATASSCAEDRNACVDERVALYIKSVKARGRQIADSLSSYGVGTG